MRKPRSAAEQLQAEVEAFPHGRVPRELRRRQVLAVANALFVERGFAAASMDELARRVGVSKPVIYELVGSKEALFSELVAQEAQALAAAVEAAVSANPGGDRMYAGALAFFRFARERRAAWDTLLTAEAVPVNAELAAARRFHAAQVARLIARGAAELGEQADPIKIEACAQAINGAFEALADWWKAHPELAAETLAELAAKLVSPGLRAALLGGPDIHPAPRPAPAQRPASQSPLGSASSRAARSRDRKPERESSRRP
jgi:AcrR family transcriptional regulator